MNVCNVYSCIRERGDDARQIDLSVAVLQRITAVRCALIRCMHEGIPPLSGDVDITPLHDPFCRLTLLSREHDWRRSEAPGLGGVSLAQIIPHVPCSMPP